MARQLKERLNPVRPDEAEAGQEGEQHVRFIYMLEAGSMSKLLFEKETGPAILLGRTLLSLRVLAHI